MSVEEKVVELLGEWRKRHGEFTIGFYGLRGVRICRLLSDSSSVAFSGGCIIVSIIHGCKSPKREDIKSRTLQTDLSRDV